MKTIINKTTEKLSICFLVLLGLIQCVFNAYGDDTSIVSTIKLYDSIPFTNILSDGEIFQYKLYTKPLNPFSNRVRLPIVHNISPLYSLISREILVNSIVDPSQTDFENFISFVKDSNSYWCSVKESYKKKNIIVNENNFVQIIKSQNKDNEYICFGEIKKNNVSAIVCLKYIKNEKIITNFSFDKEGWENEEDSKQKYQKPELRIKIFFEENNRYYAAWSQEIKNQKDISNLFNSVSHQFWDTKTKLYEVFMPKETEPEQKEKPILTNTWRIWKTHIEDIRVEAKYVSYDGKIVVLNKRDGTIVTVEYARLGYREQDYVKKLKEKEKEDKKNMEKTK
jgi:hypothetical protein